MPAPTEMTPTAMPKIGIQLVRLGPLDVLAEVATFVIWVVDTAPDSGDVVADGANDVPNSSIDVCSAVMAPLESDTLTPTL